MTDWTRVKHFKRIEWVKDPDLALPDLVYIMDEMRSVAGAPFIIHVCFDDSGHEPNSAHFATKRDFAYAVDFHIHGWSLMDQWLFIEKWPIMGLGIYPFWKNPGLHIDLRRHSLEHPTLGRRWWRNEQGEYLSFNKEMISILMKEG